MLPCVVDVIVAPMRGMGVDAIVPIPIAIVVVGHSRFEKRSATNTVGISFSLCFWASSS